MSDDEHSTPTTPDALVRGLQAHDAHGDMTHCITGVDQLHALAGMWPDWHVWRSRKGELVCATRRTPLRLPTRGLSTTIIADTVTELADALHREAMRESQAW